MGQVEERLMQAVREAVAEDRLALPTLPEVALNIQRLARDENVSAARLAAEISKDPATAVRLLKIANSAGHSTSRPAENLPMAVTRLGIYLCCNIAVGLAMEQLYRAKSRAIDQRLRASWAHSQEVAAMAHVLAAHCTVLNPELAMLAGLVHEIGVLPILRMADDFPEVANDPAALDRALAKLHPRTGGLVLRVWQFPAEIADVPVRYLDFSRRHDGPADYADVITVANLQTYVGRDHPLAQVDRSAVPAFEKLDINPEADVLEIDGVSEDLDASRAMLS